MHALRRLWRHGHLLQWTHNDNQARQPERESDMASHGGPRQRNPWVAPRVPRKAFARAALASLSSCLLSLPAVAEDGGAQVITIFGQGQTRQVQNITRDDLARALPGTSPLKTLEKLPGVQFQSADPFGAYEWSVSFSIRGFSQSRLGYTLDGIPLGDMSYSNHNGLHISRAISPENIARVTVSQGAGAVGTASTSNLGGTVQFRARDPAETAGAWAGLTAGAGSKRGFARIETGTLGSGTRAALSVSRLDAAKWKGDGGQRHDQVNARVLHAAGPHRATVFWHHSDRHETDYQDLSPDLVRRRGWDWDNYAPDWNAAVAAARSPACTTAYHYTCDDAYYLGRGLRRDTLAGVLGDFQASDALTLRATLYHHGDRGQGHWYTPYTPSSAAVPISIRTTEYDINRNGVLAALVWEHGSHTVEAGAWVEHAKHGLARRFYAVNGPEDTDRFLGNPMSTGFLQFFTTRTRQFHLQDSIALSDGTVTLDLGVKSPRVDIVAASPVGTRAAGRVRSGGWLLPQAGLRIEFMPGHEMFAAATRNRRAFQAGIVGPFLQTQEAFDRTIGTLRPETATTIDLGYRFHGRTLNGSLALYRADFRDRLTVIAVCSGILGCPSTVANVGRVATRGVEAAFAWMPARHWTWFNTLTWNDSRYRSDYTDGTQPIRTAGKRVVDTPRAMAVSELAWDDGVRFARVQGKYTGRRFSTYLNDNGVPSSTLWSLAAGWRMKSLGMLRDATLELRIENAGDRRYFSTIGTNGFVASDAAGTFATLQAGSPRQAFLTLSAGL